MLAVEDLQTLFLSKKITLALRVSLTPSPFGKKMGRLARAEYALLRFDSVALSQLPDPHQGLRRGG